MRPICTHQKKIILIIDKLRPLFEKGFLVSSKIRTSFKRNAQSLKQNNFRKINMQCEVIVSAPSSYQNEQFNKNYI